ncbi:MAG TPA: HEPN domain-containing protein [Allosphingosinicella sp.]|jgi:predicted nucleotidyltransferase/HEPN domain-containing protein
MRTDLDHLPPTKQRELERVVQILFEEFEKATNKTNGFGKHARIFKIVLYGSYARGDWVDDPVGGYHSDYDILIVVSHDKLTDFVDYWSAAEDRLMRELTIGKAIGAPVNFIVHTLKDVNRQLDQGRPFFVDVVRQGIALYEAEGFAFHPPRELPPEEARAEAQTHFERWLPSAETFLQNADDNVARKRPAEAAFLYHQAAERLYHCILLVITLYSPKSHKLNFLRSRAEEEAPELIEAWPRADKFSRRCFELLRLAYVNARYSPEYKLTEAEMRWIGERVAELQRLVKDVCEKRLAPRD